MKLFTLQELTRGKTPDGSDFRSAKKGIMEAVKSDSGILTHSLFWGSSVQEKWKRTSDIDLIFLYHVDYTQLVMILLIKLQDIAREHNVPFECLCIPTELYFGKRNIDLSTLAAILEYSKLDNSLICGERNLSFELFGYTQDIIKSGDDFRLEMHRSYTKYVLHKLDKWMREFPQWNYLSMEDRLKIAGKFLGAPSHAMRRKAQARGFSSIGFEESVSHLHIDYEIMSSYSRIELLKLDYLEVLRSFENSNLFYVRYNLFIEAFLSNVMIEVGNFFQLSASRL